MHAAIGAREEILSNVGKSSKKEFKNYLPSVIQIALENRKQQVLHLSD